jgi:hypothetical protein
MIQIFKENYTEVVDSVRLCKESLNAYDKVLKDVSFATNVAEAYNNSF